MAWRPIESVLCGFCILPLLVQFVEGTRWAVKLKPGPVPFSEQANLLAETNGLENLGQVGFFEDTYHFRCTNTSHDHTNLTFTRSPQPAPTSNPTEVTTRLHSHPEVENVWHQTTFRRFPRYQYIYSNMEGARDIERMTEGMQMGIEFNMGIGGFDYSLGGEMDYALSSNSAPPGALRDMAVAGKEMVMDDPLFPQQWYLHANGSNMNVMRTWKLGYTGRGVVVSVLDDGLEHSHPDLIGAYDPIASLDINDGDDDPTPRKTDENMNKHGTRCAGSIAGGANNGICGVGVAYGAKVGGIRLIDGEITDADEATALSHANNHIDIYSSSWGPEDDGMVVEGPGILAQAALERGVRMGRNGKGSIYVFASGNGRSIDNCNCDGYANSIYTLSIGAVDHTYSQPWYMEPCVAMIAVAFSSGASKAHAITTTDLGGACTNKHTGTSAAAPLAVGVVALALEANPLLTWRDMQHLIVQTANHIHPDDDSWVTNAAGHRVSTRFGFGLLNARSMVENAKNFRTVLPFSATSAPAIHMTEAISEGTGSPAIQRTYVSPHANTVARIEHVTVRATIDHQQRGDLELTLISPGGTSVQLLTARPRDDSTKGFVDWTFSTIHLWGENPIGEWTLVVADTVANGHTGSLVSWQLTIYGAAALKEGESYGANEFRIPLSTVTSENYSWRTLIGNFLFVGSVFSFIFVVRK
eukprot:comp18124_c1_seq1/m.18813 comp18124_c1_seq1/g.18813  ORF comp18124_c1_seq1/g.18813 comp18124_c1_seq1/m.18813 type:complete len:698 (-) comp18124_c1_seq1:43-2136(-)